MKTFRVLAGLLALTVCHLANAGMITIDPRYYAPGTDLSHATPGVTLSTWTRSWTLETGYSEPAYSNVSATDCIAIGTSCDAFDGRRVFGNGYYDGYPVFTDAARAKFYLAYDDDPTLRGSFSVFRADFDSPTSLVQLLMGGYSNGDPPWVSAFDRDGHLVAECYLNNDDNPCGLRVTSEQMVTQRASLLTLYTGTDNIAYIVAGGSLAGSRVASLSFIQTSVPEPEQFGLLVCGLFGMWATMRGRQSYSNENSNSG